MSPIGPTVFFLMKRPMTPSSALLRPIDRAGVRLDPSLVYSPSDRGTSQTDVIGTLSNRRFQTVERKSQNEVNGGNVKEIEDGPKNFFLRVFLGHLEPDNSSSPQRLEPQRIIILWTT